MKEKYKERELFHLKKEGEIDNYFERLYSICFTNTLKSHLDESLMKSITGILIRRNWKDVASIKRANVKNLKSHKLVKKNMADQTKRRKRKISHPRNEDSQAKKKAKRSTRRSKTPRKAIKPFGQNDDDVNELIEYIILYYYYYL